MKNIIQSVLVKHLGKYIDGLKNSLDIGLLDGQVTIENVSLKPSFVNELGLPFTLKFSHIEKIHINIPWTSLKEKSTFVNVKGIYVLLNISYQEIDDSVDVNDLLKSMIQRIKMEMKKKWNQGNKEQTFAEKNLIRIVDNAVVNINNIHIRFQSYCRNWDYSFGVIMDDIQSYTVDQNEQRFFYTRHFSHKEKNLPFKKILNIEKLQLYFNDEERIFISNFMDRSRAFLIRTMAHPFPKRDTSKDSPLKKKAHDDLQPYPVYQIKNLTTIRLTAVGSQRFAQDMRYIVELSVVINSIDVKLGSRQLSQLFHCIQHFYDYGLNIMKNGRKGYNFDETTEKYYRSLITKIAKEEKINSAEQNQLMAILGDVPISVLENINDEIINNIRFDKEIKKIAQVRNADKSKKLMQELLDKKQKLQAMEGIQIFKQVFIDAKIYRINMSICDNNENSIADFAILGLILAVNMDLSGEIKIKCDIKNAIFYSGRKEVSIDHFDTAQSLIAIDTTLIKNQVTFFQVKILKKQLILEEAMLENVIGWMSMIRLKPSLMNYVVEQLNYSIDITRLMMKFVCAKHRQIIMEISIPIFRIEIASNCLFVDLGRLVGTSELNSSVFKLQFADEVQINCNDTHLVEIDKGTTIQMNDKTDKISYEQIEFALQNIYVDNPQNAIKRVYQFMFSGFLNKYAELTFADNSRDQLLEGEFYLNKVKLKLRAKIRQSELVFFPKEYVVGFPQQKISLIRTRIYRLVSDNRFFIVFKEEVEKQVNIVEADNDKAMKTLFVKLKDYIQQISTAFQWEKYYRQIYKEDIATLEQIQDVNLSNNILMTLKVRFALIQVDLAHQAELKLKALEAMITYNEFNTEAALGLGGMDLTVNKEKVISDTSFKGNYESLQSKIVNFQVDRLNYQVKLFSTFSKIIAIGSEYQLLVLALSSQGPKAPIISVEEDEHRLANIKSQHNRADNINKFLLQFKIMLNLANVDGEILSYRNRMSFLKIELFKNRNEPHPSLIAQFKRISVFSMIELPIISLAITPNEITVEVDSINAQIDLQTIIYEIVKGEGSLIIKEVIKSIRDKKIAKEEYKLEQQKLHQPEVVVSKKILTGKIGDVRVQIKVTGGLNLGISMKDLQLLNGHFSWSETLFWFNGECISLVQNNGIVKWSSSTVNLCMTNFKLKLNSKEILFLIYELKKIQKFLRANKFDAIAFVQQEFNNPDEKGRVAQHSQKKFSMRIEEVELVYECGDKNPLLSVRFRPLFLTNQGDMNSISLSVWHLNRSLKLYQPIIQPLQLKILMKDEGRQIQLTLQEMYIILTQECLIDCLNQVKLLQQIHGQLTKDESNELEELSPEEIQRIKSEMLEKVFQYYQPPNFHQSIEYSFMLKVANRMGSAAIVQIFCGKKQKQRLIFETQQLGLPQIKAIYIPQKTSYHHSYELIERYQKVQLKICLMNQFYSARAITASFLLYDKDNFYIKPITFVDSNGLEIESRVAVKVTYTEGVYLIDLIGKYGIISEVNLPIYIRYSDACSINKFTLNYKQELLLPPWIVDYVTFSIKEGEYDHVLRLRPENQEEQTTGLFLLSVPYDSDKSKIELVIHKEAINQIAQQAPKLRYLKEKSKDEKVIDEFNNIRKGEPHPKEEAHNNTKANISLFNFRIIPGVLIFNHFAFPITVNKSIFEPEQLKELHQIYLQNGKEYLNVCLGDKSTHDIYIPPINEALPLNLKLTQDNYVTIYLQVRKNRQQQRIIHIYTEVHLIINLPHLNPASIITNIYQYKFIVKKEVKNGFGDRPHPSPILKDKFCFNTAHYLLSLEEKYTTMKTNGCTSNEFILFHSDFDTDLTLTSDVSGEIQAIYSVSYDCKVIVLQTDEPGRKPESIECFKTYIMPKYYIINRSDESFVVNGSVLIRTGEKITINYIKFFDLNIRDQLDFKYIAKNINNATSILFVRGTEEVEEMAEENQSNRADADSSEKIKEVNSKFENVDLMKTVTEVSAEIRENTEPAQKAYEKLIQTSQFDDDKLQGLEKGAKHVIQMKDIHIFALSKRVCDYNTACYEINGWSEWLNVVNHLNHPIILKIKLDDGIVAVQKVPASATGKIIAGISEVVEISLFIERSQTILGQFQLDQRLNHTIFLNDCEYQEINLKETKIKVGRSITIDSPKQGKQENIHKVSNSVTLKISKIRISFVFREEKLRRQLIRFSLLDLNVLAMRYKNGLYMCHFNLGCLSCIHKRISFLVLKSFSSYLQGVEGEFIERLNIDLGEVMEITLTDQLIVSLIGQIEVLDQYLPSLGKSQADEASFQEEQTYHLNSLGIKGIEIKLCMRKRISDMTENTSRLLSKVGLSIVEVQDAHIHLSPVQISTPLKQKHVNGISKMYTMQSFVGIASGLNILGNPSQFASEFEAGRNKGGLVPFFGSIVAGTSNSLSKIIGTIGSGVSELTFDRQFMKHRIDNKNIKAESFGMGLKIGLKELAHSVKSGFTGVVEQPLQGHREQGGMGALKGAIAGLTGLITKPLTGLIFAASKTIEGVNSSITYLDYKKLQREELITRPLYHKFKLVRPYKSEDQLAYNILLNWWEYSDVQLVGGYLLQNQEGDSVIDILIITCSQLILIDLESKEVSLKLRTQELLATGKFTEGVVLYYQAGESQEDQDEIVFRLQNDPIARDNLYWTLKGFIGLYAQKEQ